MKEDTHNRKNVLKKKKYMGLYTWDTDISLGGNTTCSKHNFEQIMTVHIWSGGGGKCESRLVGFLGKVGLF